MRKDPPPPQKKEKGGGGEELLLLQGIRCTANENAGVSYIPIKFTFGIFNNSLKEFAVRRMRMRQYPFFPLIV